MKHKFKFKHLKLLQAWLQWKFMSIIDVHGGFFEEQ